ncbi:MAG: hypothetical protein UEW45_06080, partial [Catenibacterium mitsuokai]
FTQVRLKGSVLKTDRGLTSCGGSNPSTCAINKYNSGFFPEFFCAYFKDYILEVLNRQDKYFSYQTIDAYPF